MIENILFLDISLYSMHILAGASLFFLGVPYVVPFETASTSFFLYSIISSLRFSTLFLFVVDLFCLRLLFCFSFLVSS